MIRRGDALVVKGLSQEVSNLLSRVRIPASALFKNAYRNPKTGGSKMNDSLFDCSLWPVSNLDLGESGFFFPNRINST